MLFIDKLFKNEIKVSSVPLGKKKQNNIGLTSNKKK